MGQEFFDAVDLPTVLKARQPNQEAALNANTLSNPHAEPASTGCPPALPRRDRASAPAHPLGSKTVTLQSRRQIAQRAQRLKSIAAEPEAKYATPDFSHTFALIPIDGALCFERASHDRRGMKVVQLLLFHSSMEFLRWWDQESLRFDAPQLHGQIRKMALDHLDVIR